MMVMGDPGVVLALLTDHWAVSGLSRDCGEFELRPVAARDCCERRGELSLNTVSFFVAGRED